MQVFSKTIVIASVSSIAVVLGSGINAQAALIGNSVNGQFIGTDGKVLFNERATVIDPGIEFTFLNIARGGSSLDLRGNSFDIFYDLVGVSSTGGETAWKISNFDWLNSPSKTILGVSLTSGNESLISNTSFTDDSIVVNFENILNSPEQQEFSFEIQTSNATAVPTPAALPSILGLGIAMARKRK